MPSRSAARLVVRLPNAAVTPDRPIFRHAPTFAVPSRRILSPPRPSIHRHCLQTQAYTTYPLFQANKKINALAVEGDFLRDLPRRWTHVQSAAAASNPRRSQVDSLWRDGGGTLVHEIVHLFWQGWSFPEAREGNAGVVDPYVDDLMMTLAYRMASTEGDAAISTRCGYSRRRGGRRPCRRCRGRG